MTIRVLHRGGALYGLAGHYDETLKRLSKETPGMQWSPAQRAWVGYADAVATVVKRCRAEGVSIMGDVSLGIDGPSPFAVSYEKLRDYQKVGADFLVAHAREGVLLGDSVGIGKSAQALRAARAFKDKTVIVCPSFVRGVWEAETAKWWPAATVALLSGTKPNPLQFVVNTNAANESLVAADIAIIHYDILYAWVDALVAWGVKTMILDECFPAGTKVDGRPIESFDPGDIVLGAIGRGVVRRVGCRFVELTDLLLVQLDDGREFICTRNHPILIYGFDDWLPAGLLQPGDTVVDRSYLEEVRAREVPEKLRVVRPTLHDGARDAILLELVRSEMELDTTSVCSETTSVSSQTRFQGEAFGDAQGRPRTRSESGSREQSSNDRAKPDADTGGTAKGTGVIVGDWPSTKSPRGERTAAAVVRTAPSESSRPSVAGPGGNDGFEPAEGEPAPLQDRSGARAAKDCNRSRWGEPQQTDATGGRQAKGSVSALPRVVRIAVPQQADFDRLGLGGPDDQGRVEVYNLEVSGHPSYTVAGGLLVHNCHYLMSEKSRRTKAAEALARACTQRIGLSATPMTSRPRDLWAPINILSEGRFGRLFTFCLRYSDAHREQVTPLKTVWKLDGASNLDELQDRLKFFMLRRTKSDVALELPERIRQVLELDVPKGCMIGPTAALRSDRIMRQSLDMAADGKIPQVIDLVAGHIEAGHKVVCFTFRKVIARAVAEGVAAKLPIKTATITGDVDQKDRKRIIAQQPDLLAATMDSTSVGIDLSYADVAVFAELDWVPSKLVQAEGRLHRFGQKRSVLIQYCVARGTGDDIVRRVVIDKLQRFEAGVGKLDDGLRDDFASKEGAVERMKKLYERLLKEDAA
jgi:hypothetical protein